MIRGTTQGILYAIYAISLQPLVQCLNGQEAAHALGKGEIWQKIWSVLSSIAAASHHHWQVTELLAQPHILCAPAFVEVVDRCICLVRDVLFWVQFRSELLSGVHVEMSGHCCLFFLSIIFPLNVSRMSIQMSRSLLSTSEPHFAHVFLLFDAVVHYFAHTQPK